MYERRITLNFCFGCSFVYHISGRHVPKPLLCVICLCCIHLNVTRLHLSSPVAVFPCYAVAPRVLVLPLIEGLRFQHGRMDGCSRLYRDQGWPGHHRGGHDSRPPCHAQQLPARPRGKGRAIVSFRPSICLIVWASTVTVVPTLRSGSGDSAGGSSSDSNNGSNERRRHRQWRLRKKISLLDCSERRSRLKKTIRREEHFGSTRVLRNSVGCGGGGNVWGLVLSGGRAHSCECPPCCFVVSSLRVFVVCAFAMRPPWDG